MKKIFTLFVSMTLASVAHGQLLKLSVRPDSTENRGKKESEGFFTKAIGFLRDVREIIDDPSKIEVEIGVGEKKENKREKLGEFLRRKKLLQKEED